MTDQTTSTSTVPDDDIGSSEDRHRDQPCRGPVASTIPFSGLEISPRGACQIASQERPGWTSRPVRKLRLRSLLSGALIGRRVPMARLRPLRRRTVSRSSR